MTRLPTMAASAVLLCTAIVAQYPSPARQFMGHLPNGVHYLLDPGHLTLLPGGPMSVSPLDLVTGCIAPGAATSSSDGTVLFVAGGTGTRGRVRAFVADGNGGYDFHSDYERPGAFFAGVAYSDQSSRLYVLESTSGELLWVVYEPGTPIPTTGWQTGLTSASIPALGSNAFKIGLLADGREPQLVLLAGQPHKIITHRLSGTFEVSDGPPDLARTPGAFKLAPGETAIPVTGTPGAVVELRRLDAPGTRLVASEIIGTSGEVTLLIPPVEFGEVFALRTPAFLAGSKCDSIMTPELRLGASEAIAGGGQIMDFPALGLMTYVGHSQFRVPLAVEFSTDVPPGPAGYAASLSVGFLGTSALRDDYPAPGLATLVPEVTIQGFAEFSGARDLAYDSISLGLSDDAALVGTVLLFQWVVEIAPGEFAISQVGGFCIQDGITTYPGTEHRFEEGESRRSSRQDTSNHRAAVASFVASLLSTHAGSRALTQRERKEFLRHLRRH